MTSPLVRRTRERLAKQREEDRKRLEAQPAALQKSIFLWILRIVGFLILLALVVFRMSGHSFY
jgi:hypothetical protein